MRSSPLDHFITTQDRLNAFSKHVKKQNSNIEAIKNTVKKYSTTFFVILVTSHEKILEERLALLESPDEYDKDTVFYNEQYQKIGESLVDFPNVSVLDVYQQSPFDVTSKLLVSLINTLHLNMHVACIEGESKRFFHISDTNLALVELKPTLYSATCNRYGIVEGTERLRLQLWDCMAGQINRTYSLFAIEKYTAASSSLPTRILHLKDYELIDLCYFINYEGDLICSEISPDGMRIRKREQSIECEILYDSLIPLASLGFKG